MKTIAGFFIGVLAAFVLGAAATGSFSPDPVGNIDPVDIDTGQDAIIRRGDDGGEDDLSDDELLGDDTDDTDSPSPSPTATAKPTATPTSRPAPTDDTDDTDDTNGGNSGSNSGPGRGDNVGADTDDTD